MTGIMNIGYILALTLAWSVFEPSPVLAQATTSITHTTGPGDLGTRMAIHGHTIEITGGSRPGSETNLFHSFEQFSVGYLDTAKFLNTTPSLQTSNILARVTGNNPSNIFGTIDATSYPGANLFLMNPAGIVFGQNATLHVNGSVAFTTANYLRLVDANGSNAGVFHANTTTTSLLTSASVEAFGFLGSNPSATIAVQGSTLAVQPGQSLSLVGGDHGFAPKTGNAFLVPNGVTVTGGHLSAPGGRIMIAGISSPGEILTRTLDSAPNIKGQTFNGLGRIHISESSLDTTGNGDGTIRIRGGRLVVDASTLYSDTGTITLDGDSIQLTNASELATSTAGAGNSGRIHLQASGDIDIKSTSLIDTFSSTGSSGQAGDILVHSNHGNVNLSGGVDIQSFAKAKTSGNTGSITIEAPQGQISLDSSHITNSTDGTGTLGEIHVKAQNMRLETFSIISGGNTSTGTQKPGDIQITLDNRLSLTGGSFISTTAFASLDSADLIIRAAEVFISGKHNTGSSSGLYDNTINSGDGGHLRLFTDNLQLTNGGMLFSKSLIGVDKIVPSGRGGAISIEGYRNPGASVMIDGTDSGIFSNAEGIGAAGDISVKASSVTIQNNGALSAATSGAASSAKGGAITLTTTDHLTLTNNASITASTSGPGNAGSISVRSNNVAITGGSTITASSTGTGNAGTVTIQGLQSPANSLFIDGIHSGIFTKTSNTGAGGNLSISSNSILIQNKGSISGETSGPGSGGNITLTADDSVKVKDSATISSSSTGSGTAGNVEINAGKQFDVQRGSITTQSNQLNGGNITILASDLVRVVDGKISTSALNGGGNGGNITIDPKVVLLQNSEILAQAKDGNGGSISIVTPLYLKDQASLVSADSQFGVNGTVTIQSPISNLSGSVGQLVSKTSPPQVLLQNRCVATAGGEQSTFLLAGRDALPGEPNGWLSSPVTMEHWTGEETAHASRLTVRNRELNSSPQLDVEKHKPFALSLRRLTPPGFLVRTFSTGATGCPS